MKEHLRILTEIRQTMNNNYQKRWGGRGEPEALPAQTCDLNQSGILGIYAVEQYATDKASAGIMYSQHSF